jgi:NADH-quinone oxidoreductase subunit N
MSAFLNNLLIVAPEIFLLISLSVVLLVGATSRQENPYKGYLLTQLGLMMTTLLLVLGATGETHYAFGGMVIDDAMARTLKVVSCAAVSVVLAYSRAYAEARGIFKNEFFALLLFALLGMMVMISANHMLVLYIGLEILSLSTCTLIALQRDSAVASEAAMKYFVLAALASGLLLYGISMLYGATGTLEIAAISNIILGGSSDPAILVFALVFIVAGLAFKLGAVPFHMWVPDVYEGAPTVVTLFMGVPKLAAFAFLMRLLVGALGHMLTDWQPMIMILSVLSMLLGNVVAIAQTNVKRMLAYSTIAHMGYLLLGVLSGTPAGYSAAMFYVISYVITAVAGFGILLLLTRAGFEADQLENLKGLNKRSPWYAFMMLLVMISMAGIPVSVGFFAKFSVLTAALDAGYTPLVVFAVMMSLIGAFYYLRVIKLMYMDEPADDTPLAGEADHRILVGLNALVLLFFGVMPQPLVDLCMASIVQSFRV